LIYLRQLYIYNMIKENFRSACYLICCCCSKQCSKSLLQRKLQINYIDATYIIEILMTNKLIEQVGLTQYRPLITDIDKMEVILDLIYK